MNEPDTFTHAWEAAPKNVKRVTERECAEWFWHAGRQAKHTEVLLEDVEEMRRLVEVRLQR